MAVTKIKPIKSTLKKALEYIQNPDKTDDKMLVSSFGCSYETADIEFAFTLSQALDKGNNLAHHLIQSFEPGEVNAVIQTYTGYIKYLSYSQGIINDDIQDYLKASLMETLPKFRFNR